MTVITKPVLMYVAQRVISVYGKTLTTLFAKIIGAVAMLPGVQSVYSLYQLVDHEAFLGNLSEDTLHTS